MAKPKLHELIAVEGELEGTAKKIMEETAAVFSKKPELFIGATRQIKMQSDTPEARLQEISEDQELTTTVGEKLDYLRGSLVRYWDAVYQKESTNQMATADLVVDGKVVAAKLPATFLLGMETRLKALRAVYEQIPTLPIGKSWIVDTGHEHKGVFVVKDDDVRVRTQKLTKPVVLYEATKEHPAQVKELTEDVPVGQVITRTWSGMISAADKSDLLGRIDTLVRACKKARQRANSTEVTKVMIGRTMLDFINTGIVGGAASEEDADAAG